MAKRRKPNPEGEWWCGGCDKYLPAGSFGVRKRGGTDSECKKCRSARSLAYYHAMPPAKKAATLARIAAWVKANPGKRAVYNANRHARRESERSSTA